ncbi:B12-binding domain-containing radical SAM protein [Thermohalobacter berrensis]|uniref:B12-binding domain-containing radical SAM protein n=1 Tax=Thermohalobacter berrensis TaxID=99594 RepID=A0A419T527_9FIRM|nr:B12-binding domain-containing radical SAM protein [Thermohalobacter berrensis]RKD32591.1 B12-binding domain-containing radical SAM protein [Thermohalobacter berrensis]
MKVLLTTLNSKYIHSSLSIRYIKSYCEDIIPNIEIEEYTINQNTEYVTGEIYRKEPDAVAFSCYIWNIEKTLEIAERLKIVNPNLKIILGGPEVSFNGKEILKKNTFIDFIVYGEGEVTFRQLLYKLSNKDNNFKDVKGLVYRKENEIIRTEPRPLIKNLDSIPSPFRGDLKDFKNKIVYFESSRGCPFNCQFCLSSTIPGLRFFSLDRVKKDLKCLIDAGVKQVKFVDRTFNAKKEYALEIMKFIMEQNVKNINFHFEVTAHILDEEILEFLKDVPEGLFQFEIGVQSTNSKTLKAIDRNTNFERLSYVVKTVKSYKNIHQHLDLIAGLPYENYKSFKKSFNDVYKLEPDKLQLGFLKLLKGSGLRQNKEKYGFKFLDKPPYEVLENDYINYSEMLTLKIIEDLVEKYPNSRSFKNCLEYIIKKYFETPFDFYEKFAKYWTNKGFHRISHSKTRLYKILKMFYIDYVKNDIDIFNEILKFDFIYNNKSNIPPFIETYKDIPKNKKHVFLQNRENLLKYIPEFKELPAKKIINKVHFEKFPINIIDFINSGYNLKKLQREDKVVLFVYDENKKVFDKCRAYDITKEFIKQE